MNAFEFDRQAITNQYIEGMRRVYPQYIVDEAARRLNECSDQYFWQFVKEVIHEEANRQYTNEDIAKFQRKARHDFGPPAFENDDVEIVPENESLDFWHDINNSAPSDIIKLTWKEDDKLCSFWKRNEQDDFLIPSDLFFSGTISLMDCEIEVNENGRPDMYGFGQRCLYRVTVFDDYEDRITFAPEEGAVFVGAITYEVAQDSYLIIPLMVAKGVDVMPAPLRVGIYQKPGARKIDRSSVSIKVKEIAGTIYAFMATWYGIQIALLHPTIKEVFQHPVKEKANSSSNHISDFKRRVAKYIKRHSITESEIEGAINKLAMQPRQRKTLVWYVIGHWRQYKDGKKVFVNGYWKGVLRETKRNLDEGRERIILTPQED